MATTTEIKLLQFDKKKALNGATLAFSTNGSVSGNVKDYVLNFQINDIGSKSEKYSGVCKSKPYFFNELGECSDKNILHNIFIVEATIENTRGTIATRGDSNSNVENVDINSLQPRESFAIAALQGIMFHMSNPLDLTGAQINQVCTKAFEIANGMMSVAAAVRAESKENPDAPENDKKDEIIVNPEELTSNTDRILYNIYIQNNNKYIDEKARFDKLTEASYEESVLTEVKGIKLNSSLETPIFTKLHPDSEIKQISEPVTVKTEDISNVNISSSSITVPVQVIEGPSNPNSTT